MDVRLGNFTEFLGREIAQIIRVEIRQLFDVENGRGLGDAADVERPHQLVEREELLLALLAARRPAEKGNIVKDGGRQVALRLEVFIARVAVAFTHLMLRVAHDGGAVHVGRHLPAEALVEEVVLRGGGEIFAAAHDMGDAHEVVVDDVGKVVGRQTVAL